MINLKYQLQHGKKSLNCLMNHILYQIMKNTKKYKRLIQKQYI